jgi:hypothetical protein
LIKMLLNLMTDFLLIAVACCMIIDANLNITK